MPRTRKTTRRSPVLPLGTVRQVETLLAATDANVCPNGGNGGLRAAHAAL